MNQETNGNDTSTTTDQFKPLPGIDQSVSADAPLTAPDAVHVEPEAPLSAPTAPHLIDPQTHDTVGGAIDPAAQFENAGLTATLPIDPNLIHHTSGINTMSSTHSTAASEEQLQRDRIENLFQQLLPLVNNQKEFFTENLKQFLGSQEGREILFNTLLDDGEFRMMMQQPYQPPAPKTSELNITVSRERDELHQIPARSYGADDPVYPDQLMTYQDNGQGVQATTFLPEIEEAVKLKMKETGIVEGDGKVFYVGITRRAE